MPLQLPLVVVPVFNALERLRACLESLANYTPPEAAVLLIDDASTDPTVRPLLRAWVDQAPACRRLLAHDRNRGFVATANEGLELAEADVVLLNSDTEVTGGWLERLSRCLRADPAIATATPWSNNGEIVSLPEFCRPNPAPPDPQAAAAAIAACGAPGYPEIPTAVGFCMAVSALALRTVGRFDERSFGRGYGEENDFCRRAAQAGLRNVLCDDAYVVHHGGASFRPLGLRPGEASLRRLLAKHPGYQRLVADFISADPLQPRRLQILGCLERAGVRMR